MDEFCYAHQDGFTLNYLSTFALSRLAISSFTWGLYRSLPPSSLWTGAPTLGSFLFTSSWYWDWRRRTLEYRYGSPSQHLGLFAEELYSIHGDRMRPYPRTSHFGWPHQNYKKHQRLYKIFSQDELLRIKQNAFKASMRNELGRYHRDSRTATGTNHTMTEKVVSILKTNNAFYGESETLITIFLRRSFYKRSPLGRSDKKISVLDGLPW